MTPTMVVAPSYALYSHWTAMNGKDRTNYPYASDYSALVGWAGPIIVLNGGSHDPHIRHLIRHPSRRARITHMEVLHAFTAYSLRLHHGEPLH